MDYGRLIRPWWPLPHVGADQTQGSLAATSIATHTIELAHGPNDHRPHTRKKRRVRIARSRSCQPTGTVDPDRDRTGEDFCRSDEDHDRGSHEQAGFGREHDRPTIVCVSPLVHAPGGPSTPPIAGPVGPGRLRHCDASVWIRQGDRLAGGIDHAADRFPEPRDDRQHLISGVGLEDVLHRIGGGRLGDVDGIP